MTKNGTKLSDRLNSRLLWPLVALGLIILFNLLFTPGFGRIQIKDGRLFGSMIDILNRGAPIMLLAIGMTLVYATHGIDLSVGSVIAITGALAATIIRPLYVYGVIEYGTLPPLWVVIVVPLLAAILGGCWNGALVAFVGVQPIIATLILYTAGRGIAQLIVRGQIVVYEYPEFQYIGSGALFGIPFPVIIVIVVFLIVAVLTRRTALGMFIEAVGANPVASNYMGIRSRQIKFLVYVLSAFCAGVAGLILTADVKAADANNIGLFYELDAIAAVIIGGTLWGGRYTLVGSVIGALIIQSLTTTILTRGVPPNVTLVYRAMVIIAVALIQSERLRFYLFEIGSRIKAKMGKAA
jgi:simple sugar transport system permease protein